MNFTTNDLSREFSSLIIDTYGEHRDFQHTSCYTRSTDLSLVFIQDVEQLPNKAAVIVTTQEIADQIKDQVGSHIICVADVRLAQAKIKQRFDDYQAGDLEWGDVHDSAVIHPSASLASGCRIGPNTTIGANCRLGENVIVRANTTIEHDTQIGRDSIINCNVNIGYNTQIGERVVIQAGAVIGSEGFGFAADHDNHYHRIPHTGTVLIGDDVHIGANTCIDRATYTETSIARGVKIDNMVHIAHNVSVDEDTLLTAQTVIAGSSSIGKRVITSGQTGILDHKTVPDDTILVHRAGVAESLAHGGMWAGSPAKPFKEWVRGQAVGKKVARLQRDLKELKSQLDKD